jgi:hypothetical protein
VEARFIAKGGGKMGFSQPHASKEDNVCLFIKEPKSAKVLDSRTVDCGWPTPAELFQGFDDWETCKPDSPLDGAFTAQTRLSIGKGGKIIYIRPAFLCSLVGQNIVIVQHKGKAQEFQMPLQPWLA